MYVTYISRPMHTINNKFNLFISIHQERKEDCSFFMYYKIINRNFSHKMFDQNCCPFHIENVKMLKLSRIYSTTMVIAYENYDYYYHQSDLIQLYYHY